ncbi:hypothetical protein MC885_007199, partial [Smutsia gigantea]
FSSRLSKFKHVFKKVFLDLDQKDNGGGRVEVVLDLSKDPLGCPFGKAVKLVVYFSVEALIGSLMNKLKPGVIKKINRLSTPIAGLDNINVFLKACEQIGLKEAQLFHPGDLQDLSNRVTVK